MTSNVSGFPIYYTLDGTDPNVFPEDSQIKFKYSNEIEITKNALIKSILVLSNQYTGNVLNYLPTSTNIEFEPVINLKTVYAKRQNWTGATPKIHVWKKVNGVDVPITNTSNWPNNLPPMTLDANGWYKYSFDANEYGFLVVYSDGQTNDYKYYTSNKWLLLNSNRGSVSITDNNPEVVTLPTPKYSFDKTPRNIVNQTYNFNGYDAPVNLTMTSVSSSGTPNTIYIRTMVQMYNALLPINKI